MQPFFHAFTECDVVPAMFGIGKKTAWNALVAFREIINTIIAITLDPTSLTLLECWTVLMFSKNGGAELLNEARKIMFTYGLRSLDAML